MEPEPLGGRQKALLWQPTSRAGMRLRLRLGSTASRNDDRDADGGADVFLPRGQSYPVLLETVKPSSSTERKDAARRDDCHGALLLPPERGEHGLRLELCKR
jgi:hypothetical protein